eukprot:CAMPEP_0169065136 /NCGR_PEP_ID=MMETSP1015-20121227/2237_1 /TAXON_ID=342587 /ORGANISM="Karlodinium micrum, Strain CCMP2283" /LENGTH=91 /DNA_ID=CAMNT_0009123679 /DNA_START=87 /DNA_END=362 /DNA_ORIENTATION=+
MMDAGAKKANVVEAHAHKKMKESEIESAKKAFGSEAFDAFGAGNMDAVRACHEKHQATIDRCKKTIAVCETVIACGGERSVKTVTNETNAS